MAEIISARPSGQTTRSTAVSGTVEPTPRRTVSGQHGKGDVIDSPELWNKTIKLMCEQPDAVRIRSRSVADTVLADITAPPVTVTQGGSAGENPHRFHLVLLLKGRGDYRWARGTATQGPGDIVLLDMTEPSQVVSPINSRLLRWSFPEALIAPFLPLRDSCPVLHLPAREGLMTVLTQHMRQLAREADRLDRTVQNGLLAHLCGLLGLAVEAEATPCPERRCNYRTFQRQRVLAYIETHLRDPDCTAKHAAVDLGISVRWLHALLEDMADGFADLVARRRLEKSVQLLEDPASDRLSIAEIAFLSGFNDLSTFYRRFGEQYGITPGKARRERLSAEALAKADNRSCATANAAW